MSTETATPQPKAKGTGKDKSGEPKKHPPFMAIPETADELLTLDQEQIEQLHFELELRLARLKSKKGELQKAPKPDDAAISAISSEIRGIGGALSAVLRRRGTLRRAARQAIGVAPSREQAIAAAVDHVLKDRVHKLVMKQAQEVLASWERDLAAPPESSGS